MRKFLFFLAISISVVYASKPPRSGVTERHIKTACDACHENLKQCMEFNFESKPFKDKFVQWVDCMAGVRGSNRENAIKKWRQAAGGLKYWPDADIMRRGNVGIPSDAPAELKFGRIQCVNDRFYHTAEQPNVSGCISCHAYTQQASTDFERRSAECNGE